MNPPTGRTTALKPWTALLLIGGYERETLRSVIGRTIEDLGLKSTVYDDPSYFVDPDVHSHEACLRAIPPNDIILAVAEASAGGTFAADSVTPEMLTDLRKRGILPPLGEPGPLPTIFQVEVLYAQALGKPTILLMPHEVQTSVRQLVTFLRDGVLTLAPLTANAPPVVELVEERNWDALSRHYKLEGRSLGLRELAFIEKLRKSAPNFITYFDPRNHSQLEDALRGRIAGVSMHWIRKNAANVRDRIDMKRSPVGGASLSDLLREEMVISPPYEILSGGSSTQPLLSSHGHGLLAEELIKGRNVLLLGEPGLGKTTTSLLSHRELLGHGGEGDGRAMVFESWRAIEGEVSGLEGLVRATFGRAEGKFAWPNEIPLPQLRWALTLDGLDESRHSRSSLESLLNDLRSAQGLLVSCREGDFERRFSSTNDVFHTIIRLSPWGRDEILQYTGRLRALGKDSAAQLIEDRLTEGPTPDFISFPLWLNMMVYLSERRPRSHLVDSSYYEVLRSCMNAVAEDEATRRGTGSLGAPVTAIWSRAAWDIHKSRREGRSLRTQLLLERAGASGEPELREIALTFLETTSDGEIALGFSHEVFLDYWLAEHIVDALREERPSPEEVGRLFSYQRSVNANRLIRERIAQREDPSRVGDVLRNAFWSLGDSTQDEFAKNQLVYLLGRIRDEDGATATFLRSVWQSDTGRFVKYAAAFSAIQMGDMSIENEYFGLLASDPQQDKLNRGYHLHYYEDLPASEADPPPLDDESSDAESTIQNLFRRLSRGEARHRWIRRIELFTLRRFLETGRRVPPHVRDPLEVLEALERETRSGGDAAFNESLKSELATVIDLVRSCP